MKPVQIFLSRRVSGLLHTLHTGQRAQFNRLLQSIRLAPEAGMIYGRDLDARLLRIASAADVHIVYTIVYRVGADHLFVVDLMIIEWTPPHSDMP